MGSSPSSARASLARCSGSSAFHAFFCLPLALGFRTGTYRKFRQVGHWTFLPLTDSSASKRCPNGHIIRMTIATRIPGMQTRWKDYATLLVSQSNEDDSSQEFASNWKGSVSLAHIVGKYGKHLTTNPENFQRRFRFSLADRRTAAHGGFKASPTINQADSKSEWFHRPNR